MAQDAGEPLNQSEDQFPKWIAIGSAALAAAYVIVFQATTGMSLYESVLSSFANVAPLALLSFAVRTGVQRFGALKGGRAVLAWILGASAFALSWYVLIGVCHGLADMLRAKPFQVWFLTGPALVWQAFQGGLVFVLIATVAIALRVQAALEAELADARAAVAMRAPAAKRPAPFLVKFADELQAIDPAEIIRIEGADDHTMIFLPTRSVRSNVRMIEWEEELEAERFVRVHRSHIINLDRLISAEPSGGGRMVAYVAGGASVPVSRAGAKKLKELSA